jgi:Domain of unknown function (DUF4277)
MASAVSGMAPVAHLPWILGVLRKLAVAVLLDDLLPPHPDKVMSCGRGVEALVLAILDGDHALYKVGSRLAERGLWPLLQTGLERESLNASRLGQILAALCAAHRNRVFGALALTALEVYSLATPWRPQETTTIALSGASEGGEPGSAPTAPEPASPVAPRPASGQSKDNRPALKQVLRSFGGSGEGG